MLDIEKIERIESTLKRGNLDDDAGHILNYARLLLEEVKRQQAEGWLSRVFRGNN